MSARLRDGDVIGRMLEGRAVRHYPPSQRYHCLAYPCEQLTEWFYLPSNSHLCTGCMAKRESERITPAGREALKAADPA